MIAISEILEGISSRLHILDNIVIGMKISQPDCCILWETVFKPKVRSFPSVFMEGKFPDLAPIHFPNIYNANFEWNQNAFIMCLLSHVGADIPRPSCMGLCLYWYFCSSILNLYSSSVFLMAPNWLVAVYPLLVWLPQTSDSLQVID